MYHDHEASGDEHREGEMSGEEDRAPVYGSASSPHADPSSALAPTFEPKTQSVRKPEHGRNYNRTALVTKPSDVEMDKARAQLQGCLRLRHKYLGKGPFQPPARQVKGDGVGMVGGLVQVDGVDLPEVVTYSDFSRDLQSLWRAVKDAPTQSFAHGRLVRMATRFETHLQDFHADEKHETAAEGNRDLYSVMKVDNHIHLAAGMTSRQLIKFIQDKLRSEPEREIEPGKKLRDVLREALSKDYAGGSCDDHRKRAEDNLFERINVDTLKMSAGNRFFHRFDVFNSAYNPIGSSTLRTAFLKSTNHIGGVYFGELTNRVVSSLKDNDTYAEMRLSIYGKSRTEWDDLAKWMIAHDLHSEENCTSRNLWIIQIPRIFPILMKTKAVTNFQEVLENIFLPLFETVIDPSSHPELAQILPSISAFDSVDDESAYDVLLARRSQVAGGEAVGEIGEMMMPLNWKSEENPPYSYHAYHLYANLKRFNDACAALGRSWNLAFRPHAGEAGESHHLATTFLLADGINHGIKLGSSPSLQFLYYIAQIGISVSPMSNNALFCKLDASPFKSLFNRGLNVTLSTDDPLIFHTTAEPLLEEYTTARLMWNLSPVDLKEIAANSVRQSGFPLATREKALGAGSSSPDAQPYQWDTACCGVPATRRRYRRATLAGEIELLRTGGGPAACMPHPADDGSVDAVWRPPAFSPADGEEVSERG